MTLEPVQVIVPPPGDALRLANPHEDIVHGGEGGGVFAVPDLLGHALVRRVRRRGRIRIDRFCRSGEGGVELKRYPWRP